jgi:polyprenyl-phospho-N-acetylgalactosaminyl synthase
MKIFCIIPAFNEEKNIAKTINDARKYVSEIVVVDDCSTDRTLAIARGENVTVLHHLINRGQGAALQTGNDYALLCNADIVVHFDADGQFLTSEINDIVAPIVNDGYDIVFGSRFLEKKSNMPFFKKYFIMRAGRLVNKIFFGLNLTDPQNGFRAMNRKALCKIKIDYDGSAHCSEILAKTVENGLKLKEVAVTVRYSDFGQGFFSGKGRGMGGIRIVKDLIMGKLIN